MLTVGLCRDVDYGNLPQWLTWLVAVVVGTYTIKGIGFARRTYDKSVKEAILAQARLVSPLGEHQNMVVSDTSHADYTPARDEWHDFEFLLHEPALEMKVVLTNNSDDQISKVVVDLLNPDGSVRSAFMATRNIFAPRTAFTFTVWDHEGFDGQNAMDREDSKVRLRFTDATGRHWQRVQGEPLESVDEYAYRREARRQLKATPERIKKTPPPKKKK